MLSFLCSQRQLPEATSSWPELNRSMAFWYTVKIQEQWSQPLLTPITEPRTTGDHEWACSFRRDEQSSGTVNPGSWFSRTVHLSYAGPGLHSKAGPQGLSFRPADRTSRMKEGKQDSKKVHDLWHSGGGKGGVRDLCVRRERTGSVGLSGGYEWPQLNWAWSAFPRIVFPT